MTENTSTHRDEALGAALRALEVPEHRPGFERELRRRLAEDRLAGGRASRPSRGRHRVRLPGRRLAVAAVALGAVAVLALPVLDRLPGLVRADVASAAEVQARVRASLGSLQSLSGTLVVGCSERGCPASPGERRWGFALTSRGDLRLVGPTRRETMTYDAATGFVRSAQRSASIGGETVFYAERQGVAPGPPDLGPPTWELLEEFGAFVRALLVAEDPRVGEIVYDGRPAWQLEVDSVPNAIVPQFTGDRFQLTVDRETGVPVRVVESMAGITLRELRVEELAVEPELGPAAFRLDFPPAADVMRSDDGFRRVPLADVRSIVGYAPLLPTFLPDGYELAEVAVAERAGPTGREAGNPPSRMVVSLSYRRGFDQLVVTTRLARGASWSDPVATGEGYVDEPEEVAIARGALAGARAELLIAPRGIPHLWTQRDGLVVTVAGALGRDELLRVTESLERRE
jgi:hypothetical protein